MTHALISASDDHLLADLVEKLTQMLADGNSADVEVFLAGHPDHAEKLRPLIPTLQMLGEIGSRPGRNGLSRTGLSVNHEHPTGGKPVLGDFRILGEVGRGGMGVVYEAEQISLRRRVALKVLPMAAMLDPRALQRFRNEAQAAAALHHSQIAPIYGVGCERGVHYYAMQFIDGLTLAEVIANLRASTEVEGEPTESHPPTQSETSGEKARSAAETEVMAALSTEKSRNSPAWFRRLAEQFVQAADALHHAHELGVTHRDIKPANLMLDRLGHIWITDFGLARIEGEGNLTMTGDLVGTLRYMSPEQALAKRIGIDHRTDIYSLGITLYEILTLHPALPGHGRQELLRQISFEEPKPPRKRNRAIPRDLETIVLKMIEKNPAERYQHAKELASDLKRFVGDVHIMARRPTLYARTLKWSRRHVTALLATLCVVTLFAASMSVGSFLILQARNDAVAKSDDLKKERDNANKMLRQMDGSIQDMFDGVSHLPTTDPGRKAVAEQQVKLFENLKSSDDKSPVVRELAASAHHRLAHLQIDSGEHVASAENFRKTIALLESLAADDPQNASFESQLAEALTNYGRLLVYRGSDAYSEAEKLYKTAIPHAERALILDPQNLEATVRLAWPYGTLGGLYSRQGRHADAIRCHRKEIELHESVVARSHQDDRPQAAIGDGRGPANWNNRLYLAAAHGALADTFSRARDFESAIEEVSIALDIQKTLDRERPTDYLGRSRVVGYYLWRAVYCLRIKDPPYDALADIELALQTDVSNPGLMNLVVKMLRESPGRLRDLDEKRKDENVLESIFSRLIKHLEPLDRPEVKESLADAYVSQATFFEVKGNHTQAEASWVKAAEILEELSPKLSDMSLRHVVSAHVSLAKLFERSGRFDAAAVEIRKVINAPARTEHEQESRKISLHTQLASVEEAGGNILAAERAFRDLFALAEATKSVNPENLKSTYWSFATFLLRHRKYKEAVTYFERAKSKAAEDKDVVSMSLIPFTRELAMALAGADQGADALEAVQKSPILDGNNDCRLLIAQMYIAIADITIEERHDTDIANQACERALVALEGLKTSPPTNLVLVTASRGRSSATLFRLNGQEIMAVTQADLALVFAKLGRHEEAKRLWELSFRTRATAAYWRPRMGPMGKELEMANNLAWKMATCPYPDGQNPSLALELSFLTIQNGNTNGVFWNTLGVAHYRLREWRASITALNRSDELIAGGHPANWFFLAMAHWQIGDKKVALEQFWWATAWMDAQTSQDEELLRFKKEAGELLGDPVPTAQQRAQLAEFALTQKHRPEIAIKWYERAFADEPKLAEDVQSPLRFNAACAALLAATRKGTEADKLDDSERFRLKHQALAWLRGDLEGRKNLAESFKPQQLPDFIQRLEQFQQHPDLASIRDDKQVQQLPAEDQELCRKLWADHTELVKRLREKNLPGK